MHNASTHLCQETEFHFKALVQANMNLSVIIYVHCTSMHHKKHAPYHPTKITCLQLRQFQGAQIVRIRQYDEMEAGGPHLNATFVLHLCLRHENHVAGCSIGARHVAAQWHDAPRQATLEKRRKRGGGALDAAFIRVQELGCTHVKMRLQEGHRFEAEQFEA